MTDPELRKRIQRYFFAQDHFFEKGMSEYWLSEMKNNRRLIEDHLQREEQEEADKLQYKLF